MRAAWAIVFLTGCGFPDVRYSEAGVDATVQDTGSSGMDTGVVDVVSTGCKSNTDCTPNCIGMLPNCGCVGILADSAAPFCDTACLGPGCLNKKAVCIDGGMCVIQ
jgi:hypothetical protein